MQGKNTVKQFFFLVIKDLRPGPGPDGRTDAIHQIMLCKAHSASAIKAECVKGSCNFFYSNCRQTFLRFHVRMEKDRSFLIVHLSF